MRDYAITAILWAYLLGPRALAKPEITDFSTRRLEAAATHKALEPGALHTRDMTRSNQALAVREFRRKSFKPRVGIV